LSLQIVAKPSKAVCHIISLPTTRQVFQTILLWAIAHKANFLLTRKGKTQIKTFALLFFFGFLRFFHFSLLLILLGFGGLSVALAQIEKLPTLIMS